MGFCLFNNVALAASHALDAHALERVLILDWDVHHGNGTNDLFHAAPRSSTPRSTSRRCTRAPARRSDRGSGPGEGYTINLPVPAGSGDDGLLRWCPRVDPARARSTRRS